MLSVLGPVTCFCRDVMSLVRKSERWILQFNLGSIYGLFNMDSAVDSFPALRQRDQ